MRIGRERRDGSRDRGREGRGVRIGDVKGGRGMTEDKNTLCVGKRKLITIEVVEKVCCLQVFSD